MNLVADFDEDEARAMRDDRSHQRSAEQRRFDAWRDALPDDHPDKHEEGADA